MQQIAEQLPSWRERAKEARKLVAEARDDQMQELLTRLAEAYEALAQRDENQSTPDGALAKGPGSGSLGRGCLKRRRFG